MLKGCERKMKISKVEDLKAFEAAINQCKSDVWLESIHGDKYNLKSVLCRYVAFGELIKNHNNDLELFCSEPADETNFYPLFRNHQL